MRENQNAGGTDTDYAYINHGYAATVHKSQGVTVDLAHVLASRMMDRHAAYVGLTRHRDGVHLHWSAEEIGNRAALSRGLGREGLKDTSLDYGPGASGSTGRVQEQAERDDLAWAYGERRGLRPLVPVSEIVVPAGQAARPRVPLPRLARRKAERGTLLSGLRSMLEMQEAQSGLLGRVAEAFAAVSTRRETAAAAPKPAGVVSAVLAALARAEEKARAQAQVERAVLTLLQESTPGRESIWPFGSAKQSREDRQAVAEARARLAVETPVLLTASVPGSSEPTPEAVREAIASDPPIGMLRQRIAALVARIYRDPDAAGRQLAALEASANLRDVHQVLEEAPERFGALLGRAPGLLTSGKATGQRSDALLAALQLTQTFELLDLAQREIPHTLRQAAMAQQRREGAVVHDLSPGARVAVAALEAATAKLTWAYLRDWREMDRLLAPSEPRRTALVVGRAPMLQAWATAASDARTQAELVRLEASVRQRLTPGELSAYAQMWLESSSQTQQHMEPVYRVAAWAMLIDYAAGVTATNQAWQAQADAAGRQRAAEDQARQEKARQEAEQTRLRQEQQAGLQRRPRPRPGPSSGPSIG